MISRPFLLLMLVLTSLQTAFLQSRVDFKFIFDGVNREFIISKPSGPVPAGGYPIVMMLHGTTGDGERFYLSSGWKELGESGKFISVFPSSLAYCYVGDLGFNVTNTKWNNGDLQSNKCRNQVQDFKDDVKFLRKVLDTLKKTNTINSQKVFAAGFSNGSVMVNKLAIEMSEVFAAVASNAGLLHPLDSTAPIRYLPMWQTIGIADENLTANNGGLPLPFNDSLNPIALKFSAAQRGAQNLKDSFTLIKSTYLYTYNFNKPKSTNQKNNFLVSFIKDLTHAFPNGVNHPVSAPALYWDFFKQATRNTTAQQSLKISKHLHVYPVPATDQVWLRLPLTLYGREVNVDLINVIGQRVSARVFHNSDEYSLSVDGLNSGIYLAHIYCAGYDGMAKIVVR